MRLLAILAILCGLPSSALAIEAFCAPVDLCAAVPRDSGGTPVYNHTDPTKPWVIGGTEVVSLTAGEHQAGGSGDFKVAFVIENGTLEVKDLPGEEAGFGAWLVLCDQATFRVHNAGFRSYANRDFEFPIFAFDQSHIDLVDARFYTMRPELEALGQHGHLLQVMGDSSTLSATKLNAPMSVNFPDNNGFWELAATQSSVVTVQDMMTLAELYVQGNAQLTVTSSFFFDLFFEVCPGDTYSLADLPALCDLRDPVAGCFTASHASIDYSLSPPATPFTLTLQNDKVFSWAVSTYAGSSVEVSNVPLLANFAVGLGGVHDDLQLRLVPGAVPIIEGVTDRTLTFTNVAVSGGFMLWPSGSSHVTVLPGSEVADVLPGDTAIVDVQESVLRGAQFMTVAGTGIRVVDTAVQEGAQNAGGTLWAVRSTFDAGLHLAGPTYFADTPIPTPFTYDSAASLYRVELTSPADGSSTYPDFVNVEGTVRAQTAAGEISPFPLARLEVRDLSTSILTEVAILDAPHDAELLATVDARDALPGDYELRLYFIGSDGEQAMSSRLVTILDRCADVSCPAPAACRIQGMCDPSTGLCTDPLEPAGATCDDGDACTAGDTCDGTGVCVPGAVACGGGGDDPPGKNDEQEDGGCAAVPGPSWLVVLAALGWARRRQRGRR